MVDKRRSEGSIAPSLNPADEFPNRYLSKIVFTYILGYQVDIGHMEAVNLISSPKYSEKQIVRIPTDPFHLEARP